MKVLGKKINYIHLHNFLTRIETTHIHSILHIRFDDLMDECEAKGDVHWKSHLYTKEEYLEVLREEEGLLVELVLDLLPGNKPVVSFIFNSGNEYRARLKNQEQFAQIFQYLVDYKYVPGD